MAGGRPLLTWASDHFEDVRRAREAHDERELDVATLSLLSDARDRKF